jgi:predicted nucleotidyltransferase
MLASLVADRAGRLQEFCRQNGIEEMAVFGSATREDFGEASDVDVLVRFEPGRRVGLLEMVRLERELSRILGGRSVDLLTVGDLHPLLREQVLREKVVIHSKRRSR